MRKILSLLLIFTMIFTLPAVASASNADDSAPYQLLSQLGVTTDVKGNADGNVTRAEFTAMVVRGANMLGLTPDTTVFEDCSNSPFNTEIHIAKALGITNGTSAHTFSPDLTVSTAVASKMAVAALGYSDKAEAMGGYPAAYLQLASSLKLLGGVEAQGDVISLSDAYVLVYNMILADAAVVSGVEDGNLLVSTSKGVNLLTENFGYTHIEGVVDTVCGHGVNYGSDSGNSIEIAGVFYKTDFDFTHLLGYSVDAWCDKDGFIRAAVPTDSNKTHEIDSDDVVSYSSHILKVYNEETDREKSYEMERGFSFIWNGRAIAHCDDDFKFPEGTLALVDNDANGKYDFAIANKTEHFVVAGINAVNGVIYDEKSAIKSISLESDDNYTVSLLVNGAPASVYELEENMVCEVLMSRDGGLCKISAEPSIVSGTVSEKGTDYCVIDGKEYKYTSYFNSLGITLSLGTAYDLLLSSDNRIVSVANLSQSAMKYGYYMDYSKKGGLDSTVSLKIMTTLGEIVTFEVKDKLMLDGAPIDASSNSLRTLLKTGDIPNYQVVRYKESNGVITHLDTADSADAAWTVGQWEPDDNALTKFVDKKTVHYRSSVTFGIPNVSFKNAVIFEVPRDLKTRSDVKYSDELFMVTGSGTISNDTTPTVDAYDYDERYLPSVIVLYRSTDSSVLATPSSSSVGYMVRELSDAIDSEGAQLKLLKVFGGGKYQQFFIDATSYHQMTLQGKIPARGDIVRLTTNYKGYVVGISKDVTYDESAKTATVNYGQSGVSTTSYEYLTYYSGRVLAHGNGHIALFAESVPSEGVKSGDGIVNLGLGTVKYVIYNTKTGEIGAGNSASVVSKLVGGIENASHVVCKTSHYSVNTIYIYIEE